MTSKQFNLALKIVNATLLGHVVNFRASAIGRGCEEGCMFPEEFVPFVESAEIGNRLTQSAWWAMSNESQKRTEVVSLRIRSTS